MESLAQPALSQPEPNVGFNLYRSTTTGELAVGVVTLKSVHRGEELLADYGTKFGLLD